VRRLEEAVRRKNREERKYDGAGHEHGLEPGAHATQEIGDRPHANDDTFIVGALM
jgi:hypothetical protein